MALATAAVGAAVWAGARDPACSSSIARQNGAGAMPREARAVEAEDGLREWELRRLMP